MKAQLGCATTLALMACGVDRDMNSDAGGPLGGDTSALTEGGDDAPGVDEDDGGLEGGGARLDVAAVGDLPPVEGGEDGCAKVDFLFVIDNSSSMIPAQEKLIASFPEFIAAIQAYEPLRDFQILVTDSDETLNQCERFCLAGMPLGEEKCGGHTCGTHQSQGACAVTLGAGVRYPAGGGASNRDCGLPEGQLFMTAADPDVAGTFACAAQVGNWGHFDEQPARAAIQAVTTQVQPGACNEGFVRPDAILVVTIITNAFATADEAKEDTAQQWHDQLLAAKGGDENALVVITVSAKGDAFKDIYVELGESFGDRGHALAIDDEDFAPGFDAAVSTIQQTCDALVPPG